MCKHHSGFTYQSISEMSKSSRLASSCRHGYLVALEKLFLLSLRRQREGQALNDEQKTIPSRNVTVKAALQNKRPRRGGEAEKNSNLKTMQARHKERTGYRNTSTNERIDSNANT